MSGFFGISWDFFWKSVRDYLGVINPSYERGNNLRTFFLGPQKFNVLLSKWWNEWCNPFVFHTIFFSMFPLPNGKHKKISNQILHLSEDSRLLVKTLKIRQNVSDVNWLLDSQQRPKIIEISACPWRFSFLQTKITKSCKFLHISKLLGDLRKCHKFQINRTKLSNPSRSILDKLYYNGKLFCSMYS